VDRRGGFRVGRSDEPAQPAVGPVRGRARAYCRCGSGHPLEPSRAAPAQSRVSTSVRARACTTGVRLPASLRSGPSAANVQRSMTSQLGTRPEGAAAARIAPPIGVLVVDDHVAFRQVAHDVVGATGDFEMLGEASS
jgi:hypothetical protein